MSAVAVHPAASQAGGVSVTAMLEGIQSKLITSRRVKPVVSTAGDNVYMVAEETGRIKWVQPSGISHSHDAMYANY